MAWIASGTSLLAAAGLALGSGGCGADGTPAHHDAHRSASPGDGAQRTATTTRLEVDARPAFVAGSPSTWTLRVLDATSNRPLASFDSAHGKLMHLIVVAADGGWFNHLHPVYRGDGRFEVTTTLPSSGSYVLFADYVPSGRDPEVYRHELATTGETLAIPPTSPAHDVAGKGGWLVRTVASHDESNPASAPGARYEVALMPMPAKLVPGRDVMLHFQVRDAQGTPVTDLDPYLGALGHAVLLSSDSRTYLHTHPVGDDDGGAHGKDHGHGTGGSGSGAAHGDMHGGADHGDMHGNAHDDSHGGSHGGGSDAGHSAGGGHGAAVTVGGPDVIFHTRFPAAGLYRIWAQFSHRGKIITAPFVLEVEPAGS